jgi:RHS repeat-associated protein
MTRRDGMSVLVSLLLGWLLLVSPVLQAATETITWIHTDHLGSPVMGRNASGQTVWQQDYGPWGERVAVAGSPGVPEGVGYTGHYEDRPMGLVYAGARWYDPQVGRFLSPDAVRFDVGGIHHFNRYAYAYLNPYRFIDPDGNQSREAAWAALGEEDPGRALAQGARSVADRAAAVGEAIEPNWLSAIPWIAPLVKAAKGGGKFVDAATPVGRRGSPLDVPRGSNPPARIGDRDFTGHALDQMQARGVTPTVVNDTIKRGVESAGRDGARIFKTDQLKVILNPSGSVKTVITQ